MVNSVEELLNVEIDDPFIPFVQIAECLQDSALRPALRSETAAVRTEFGLEYKLKSLSCHLLDHAVRYIGDAKRPFLAVGLGNIYPPYRLWFIFLFPNVLLELFSVVYDPLIQLVDFLTVRSGRSLAGFYSLDCFFDVLSLSMCSRALSGWNHMRFCWYFIVRLPCCRL